MSARKHTTKDYINIALYYLMSKRNYQDITVTDICNKAKVSRMSFYRYYNNKEDIFINYCDERFEDFFRIINEKKVNDVYSFLLEAFHYVQKYARQVTILKRACLENLLVEKFTDYGSYLAGRVNLSNSDDIVVNRIVAAFLAGGIANILLLWFELGLDLQAKEMTDIAYNIFGSTLDEIIAKKNSHTLFNHNNKEKKSEN
ncbi:MAG TPA: TetR/AcrR family transcriptional regulator [Erysipelotrichaceae bacterium]|nr:TetR/AcrR family transcriptional regulator [Erysipelotrichaceae bacterium]